MGEPCLSGKLWTVSLPRWLHDKYFELLEEKPRCRISSRTFGQFSHSSNSRIQALRLQGQSTSGVVPRSGVWASHDCPVAAAIARLSCLSNLLPHSCLFPRCSAQDGDHGDWYSSDSRQASNSELRASARRGDVGI